MYLIKSKNIKKRVMQHFSKSTEKAAKMAQQVADITYEETGSELIALLLESFEIKALQPEINKASRSREYPYFIYSYIDSLGSINFNILKNNQKNRKGKHVKATSRDCQQGTKRKSHRQLM